jgi:hypothetical protein
MVVLVGQPALGGRRHAAPRHGLALGPLGGCCWSLDLARYLAR